MGTKAKSSRKKIYRKTPAGRIKIYFEKKQKKGKAKCALCGRTLLGTSNQRKRGKSKKRPTAMFAGELCNICRTAVIEEAIKVAQKIKKLKSCDIAQRKYIEQALKSFEQ